MAFPTLFDALKLHLKAHALTYADVAKRLEISEATVKRIFSTRDCSLERFAELCDLVQVDIAELARSAPRERRLLNQLTLAQEEQLVADEWLFVVAVSLLNQLSVEGIVATYRIDMAPCIALLMQLERMGMLELHANNHVRLNLSRTFAWRPNGPIMRRVAAMAPDYFNYPFIGSGEFMRIINVRISEPAAIGLVARMEQVAREYSEQHAADATLPLDNRPVRSVCLAVRHWQPAMFSQLLRETVNADAKIPPSSG